MRTDGFLRAPIRGDHQNRMQNLQVSEAALTGNPLAVPYPQSLTIVFSREADTSEVQIAPLCEGSLRFFADNVGQNPSDPALVSEAEYPNWSVTGDLILSNWYGLEEPFKQRIPFITPCPAVVRYSKVQITLDFLFTTLRRLSRIAFVYSGSRIDQSDAQWFEKFVVQFLRGKASVPCPHDASDAAQDFALNPMPSVKLDPPGSPSTLTVTIASLSEDVLDPNWFQENPAYDGISGDPLIDPQLAGIDQQFFNPLHASHSVIPPQALFQAATAAAYAADHDAASPLRTALSAPRADGKTYRRIDLFRPPIPGPPLGRGAHAWLVGKTA